MGGCLSMIARLVIDTLVARAVERIANEIIRRLTGARRATHWLWPLLTVLGFGGIRRISKQSKYTRPG